MTWVETMGQLGLANSRTFLGLASCKDVSSLTAPIAIVGVPGATSYESQGAYCRNGPDALRAAASTLIANIDKHDFDSDGRVFPTDTMKAVDCGNLPFDESDSAANRAGIAATVSTILTKGAVPMLLGGDDSIQIPMLDALQTVSDNVTILQIDAHIDWREEYMGERLGLSSTMRRASEMKHVRRIIQVGQRGLSSAATSDYEDASRWGANIVPAERLHADGLETALNLIPQGSDIAICIDFDALDPAIMPGVTGRSPGGLSYWQVINLIRGASRRGQIRVMGFVEFLPECDVDAIAALTCVRIIATSLGIIARQASIPPQATEHA